MLTNRSAPHAHVVPMLTVADVRAAVAWYATVFGFVEHVQIGEGHRAQLGLPDGGELIVAEVRPGRRLPTWARALPGCSVRPANTIRITHRMLVEFAANRPARAH